MKLHQDCLQGGQKDNENGDGTVQFLDLLDPEVMNFLTSEMAFLKVSSSRQPNGNLKADFHPDP